MSDYALIVLFFAIVIPLFMLFFMLYQKLKSLEQNHISNEVLLSMLTSIKQEFSDSGYKSRVEMQQRLDGIAEILSKSQQEAIMNMQNQFKNSATIIKEVTERLARIDETNKQVLNFSKQMQSLENILKNPKQRGILGEYFLETLLANVLQPNQYKMQYKFRDGEIVDAAIFYRDRIIPVDAKFSLEKYNRLMEETDSARRTQIEKEFKSDVKSRIDETAKYIKPEEGTTDFAFMFIPAEGVYYNLLIYSSGSVSVNTHDLIEYAFSKHVIIVSPTSFYAYLETVLQGLKQQKVEENIKAIIEKIKELGNHLKSYEDFMVKLGKNISATVNSYNSAVKEFKKVDKDIYRITEGDSGGDFDHKAILIDDGVIDK
ncbi:MAG TPA: DNA recombination protein RmuC [Spirochaetota bacterium]|jgi:DNA recombination protein RmuC|nr:DNA recombination protein RmuC [Spirochaetota bacterium]